MSAASAHLLQDAAADPASGEERVVLHGISWTQYEAILKALGDAAGVRLAYLEGALEIMSPGKLHEGAKTTIARLIELYALEREIVLEGYGSTTFRKKAKERGVEPDECWCVGGAMRKVPDVVFEVVVTSWKVDRLAIYEGLGVPELWIWKDRRFLIFTLRDRGYVAIGRSRLLPDLDLEIVARFARAKSQTDAVRGFRAWLSRHP